MSNDTLKLYKTINLNELEEKIGFKKSPVQLSYFIKEKDIKNIDLGDSHLDEIMINDFEKNWTPDRHNLILKQSFSFSKPGYLYGENRITNKDNILALGLHLHSRSSNFQKTYEVGEISNELDLQILKVEKEFSVGELRGLIEFNYFLYLKKLNKIGKFQSAIEGTTLSTEFLESYSIGVDGSGSEFPMLETYEPKKGLWWLEFNYEDIYQDEFDTSNIILYLNQSHPEFDTFSARKRIVDQFYMKSIIIEAMATITAQIILIDGLLVDEKNTGEKGSIAKAVWYWISTFNIDTTSLTTIQKSFHDILSGRGGNRG